MRIKTSIIAKILAWFLIVTMGTCFLGSGLLAVWMEANGFYRQKYSELRDEKFDNYKDRYSARVLHHLNDSKDSNQEYFADKNFKYGVIRADFFSDLQGLDLNNTLTYVETNFDWEQNLVLENLHVFECTINENTYFSVENPDSIWGHYWISNTNDNWKTYEIDKFVYDVNSGIIFAESAEKYYPIPRVVMYINKGSYSAEQGFVFDSESGTYKTEDVSEYSFGEQQYDAVMEIFVETTITLDESKELFVKLSGESEKDGITFNQLEETPLQAENWKNVQFCTREEVYEMSEPDEYNTDFDEVEIVIDETMSTMGNYYNTTVEEVTLYYKSLDRENALKNVNQEIRMSIGEYGERHIYVRPQDLKSDTYFVLSYQDDSYVYDKESTLPSDADLFAQFDLVMGTLYSMRYNMLGICVGSLLVFLAAFVFLACAAGHKKGHTELVESRMNRVSLEVYATIVFFAEAFLLILADEISWRITAPDTVFWIIISGLFVVVAGLLLTIAALEFITRIKLGVFWKNTICFWIIGKLFGGAKQAIDFVAEHTSLVWKAILGVGVLSVAEVLVIIMSHATGAWILAFVLKGILMLILALSAVSQLKKLKEAGEHMAKGDLTYRVDTKGLLWDFKKHGENLNSVSEGLALAVEERMKSERFKTELITNVSHDIKTPLTSIINYVDLMQKEEVDNIKIVEYLEVLERQSKRLKKLLEDLLEASKASAGTLSVGFETLEAGVFMVQTVGEFEEKLAAKDLELIIKKPEEAVYINADGRHFWRIIDNLMNNICKYAQPNTRVYINLEVTEDEVYIIFRNTSRYPLNITSEELVERFVRGDESRHTEGSGLGLSIAQSLMELMHGRFELVVDGDLFKVVLMFKREKHI